MDHPFATVRDLLRFAITRFNRAELSYGHGNANAYDEAAYLILHSLDLPLDTLEPFLDARLMEAEIDDVMAVIEMRAGERMPAAYITGEAWMHGYRFHVDERVIVPRSLIGELLIERLQPWISDAEEVGAVLDLCTGSGCLAIIAADVFRNAEVDAVDLSEDALDVAETNLRAYHLQGRVSLFAGDLFEPLPTRRYDVIISNPPYVNAESMSTLPPEYRREPALALAGGDDGLDIVRRIIEEARQWLSDDGVLIIEIGHERAAAELAFGGLEPIWLSTSAGDDSVFLIRAADLPD